MKKLFILLLTLTSMHCFAQLERTAIFDFSSPGKLNPAISMGNYAGFYTDVSEIVFTDGLASASFLGSATMLTWTQGNNDAVYYLTLGYASSMCISVSNGCYLKKIEMSKVSSITANVGSYSTNTNTEYAVWTPSDDNTKEVYFTHKGQEPIIQYVKVTYVEPSLALKTTGISPTPTEEVQEFKTMRLTYGNAKGSVSVKNSSGITIVGEYTDKQYGSVNATLKPTAADKTVILTMDPAIKHDGTFTISVPSNVFKDAEGYENFGFTTTVKVKENRATFDTVSISPIVNHGVVYSFPEEIVFEFASNIGHIDTDHRFRLFREGVENPVGQMKLAAVEGDNKKCKLVFHSKAEDFFAKGVYSLDVDEKVIFNSNYQDPLYERYNPRITLRFTYADAPNPLQPKWNELARLKEEAAYLYSLIGKLGYPKVDVAPNKLENLKDIVAATSNNNGELDAQIASLKTAIKTFYNVTDVVLPSVATSERDGWYTITSVARGGSELPLHYENGAVKVGGKATSFQVVSITDAGVIVLKTADGHFLHVLTTVKISTLASEKNVTSSKSYVNNLTLAKLKLAGEETDQKPVAGLFTIKGALGRDFEDRDLGTAIALVAHPAGTIITDPAVTTLYFDTDKSSGFRFAVGSYPGDAPKPVAPKATLVTNSVGSNTMPLTLIISGKVNEGDITKVSLNNAAAENQKPYFVEKNVDGTEGGRVTSFTGTAIIEVLNDGKHGNYFKVNVNGLKNGKYYLKMPIGTFTYAENTLPVADEAMSVEFTIGHNFTHDLQKHVSFSNYPVVSGNIPIRDIHLNEFRVYAYKDYYNPNVRNFFVDPSVKVQLYDYFYSQNEVLREGHFVEDDSFYDKDVWAYKVVWEPKIEAGDYPELIVGVKVQENTFGDTNFGKWLQDPSSVSEESCHVNSTFVVDFKVDNANVPFDPNDDGVIDVADIAVVIDVIAGALDNIFADVNGDGVVDVADIATLITLMAIQNSL